MNPVNHRQFITQKAARRLAATLLAFLSPLAVVRGYRMIPAPVRRIVFGGGPTSAGTLAAVRVATSPAAALAAFWSGVDGEPKSWE